uniref:Uncharacterized protein n=1 Tax=Fagus sylvatica TaxID=28930 RepID=A0A2N9GJQ4_FAGSY
MDSGGEIGACRRVASPMVTCPPPNDRSAEEDSNGGAVLRFRSPEDRVLECECGGGAWWRGFVDRATIYPMVEVVARLDAWKLKFRGSPCLAELGSSEIAPVHAKTPGNAVPTDGANIHLHKFHDESIPTNTIDDDALKLISSSIQQVIVDAKVGPLSYEKGLSKADIL